MADLERNHEQPFSLPSWSLKSQEPMPSLREKLRLDTIPSDWFEAGGRKIIGIEWVWFSREIRGLGDGYFHQAWGNLSNKWLISGSQAITLNQPEEIQPMDKDETFILNVTGFTAIELRDERDHWQEKLAGQDKAPFPVVLF